MKDAQRLEGQVCSADNPPMSTQRTCPANIQKLHPSASAKTLQHGRAGNQRQSTIAPPRRHQPALLHLHSRSPGDQCQDERSLWRCVMLRFVSAKLQLLSYPIRSRLFMCTSQSPPRARGADRAHSASGRMISITTHTHTASCPTPTVAMVIHV